MGRFSVPNAHGWVASLPRSIRSAPTHTRFKWNAPETSLGHRFVIPGQTHNRNCPFIKLILENLHTKRLFSASEKSFIVDVMGLICLYYSYIIYTFVVMHCICAREICEGCPRIFALYLARFLHRQLQQAFTFRCAIRAGMPLHRNPAIEWPICQVFWFHKVVMETKFTFFASPGAASFAKHFNSVPTKCKRAKHRKSLLMWSKADGLHDRHDSSASSTERWMCGCVFGSELKFISSAAKLCSKILFVQLNAEHPSTGNSIIPSIVNDRWCHLHASQNNWHCFVATEPNRLELCLWH